jgi:HSP20 family protein
MLEPLKRISDNVEHAWQQLAEGWHELIARSRDALTRFSRGHDTLENGGAEWLRRMPTWGIVAAEIEQDDENVHVRIELPGMDKKDIELDVRDDALVVRGEKRFARESSRGRFTLMERSYGRFERAFALPCAVDADRATAKYRDGVLSVSMPKLRPGGGRLKIS